MKKALLTTLITTALALVVTLPASAQEEKKKKQDPNAERTIRGTGTCAKCDLGETDKCQNVIQTTRKDKEGKEQKVTFYLADNDVSKAFHKEVCKGAKPVVAVGKVARDGGKQILTVSKIEVSEGKAKKKE
jgi:biopolymer transport protein ExbD